MRLSGGKVPSCDPSDSEHDPSSDCEFVSLPAIKLENDVTTGTEVVVTMEVDAGTGVDVDKIPAGLET